MRRAFALVVVFDQFCGGARALRGGGRVLSKDIKMPDPVPAAGVEAAVACMESGRLFRYNVASAEESEVSRCEDAFAGYTGHRFALGLNSCGSAIFLMLKCAGAVHGDEVLTNGFTFTAVPSAIVHAGCEPVYVECTPGYVVDVVDLERKLDAHPDARFFVISHMRGKMASMDEIEAACARRGVALLEDAAHALGVLWKGEHSGHHGAAAAYSSQSYKMLNSGEGGFFCTDDDDLAARAMAYAGAYETLARKHARVPSGAALARAMDGSIPNFSLRMHEATAAMLTPQLLDVDDRRAAYNERYGAVAAALDALPGVTVPRQRPEVTIVGDSVQFNVDAATLPAAAAADALVARCERRGLPVERFGAPTNARNFATWKYARPPACGLPATAAVIGRAFDVRLPSAFDDEDLDIIVEIIADAVAAARADAGLDADSKAANGAIAAGAAAPARTAFAR